MAISIVVPTEGNIPAQALLVATPSGGMAQLAGNADGTLGPCNQSIIILPSAARTTTQTSADQINQSSHGLIVIVDVTTAGTGSITMKIQGKSATGIYYDILVGAAITTAVTNIYRVIPDLTAAANSIAKDAVPRNFRIIVTANNANSMTYSVSAELVG